MNIRLDGQVVLITGALGGIGKAAARQFAECGATVIAHYRSDSEDIGRFLQSLPGIDHGYFQADLQDQKAIHAMFGYVRKNYGRLDVLVNNAGYCPKEPFLDIKNESLEQTMAVNFTAPFICAREAARIMKERGGGKILFVASVDGDRPGNARAHYASSKAAELQLMRNIALELAGYSIQVNAVSPGAIDTPAISAGTREPAAFANVLKGIPLRRLGEPSEVAGLLVYLASRYADYITGSNFVVDGGLSLMRGY